RTAGINDRQTTNDQRRCREAPHRHFPLCDRGQVLFPYDFASEGIQAHERSSRARDEQPAISHRRRRSRTGTAERVVQTRCHLAFPNLPTVIRVVTNHGFHRAALLLREEKLTSYGEG